MSVKTIVTCDRCKRAFDCADIDLARRYFGGRSPRKESIKYVDREEMQFDLCESCWKVVRDSLLKSIEEGGKS
jgi:hypothetical protein